MSCTASIDPALLADFKKYALFVLSMGQAPACMDAVSQDDLSDFLAMHMNALAAIACVHLSDGFAKSSAFKKTYRASARIRIASAVAILNRNSRLAALIQGDLTTTAPNSVAA